MLPEAVEARIATFANDTLPQVAAGRFANGFTCLLMPAFTETHRAYAVDGPAYPGLCDQPVMGWVAGVLLAEIGSRKPLVFDGRTGQAHEDAALAMHVRLPGGMAAELDIVNLFAQGGGPEIVFPADGFSAGPCTVDGKACNLASYLVENAVDTKLPLVADYAGAQVNVAVRAVDAAAGTVAFYAPVRAGQSYRLARPVPDYAAAYAAGSGGTAGAGSMLACNCILNFLHAELEGKATGGFVGPVTFGEIAYVLLNQTLVRLDVAAVAAPALAPEMAAAS